MIEKYPSELLQNAVEAIGSLPGIGSRSALRLAMHLLNQPKENVHHFTDAINRLADEVQYCPECMMISDNGLCSICSDRHRDHRTICVVENVRDVMSIENTGQYRGVYHVLGGIISPIDGIGPSDLTIRQLVDRLHRLTGSSVREYGPENLCHTRQYKREGPIEDGRGPAQQDNFQAHTPGQEDNIEVILALSGDVEGETTAFYIYRQIAGLGVKVSTLARGLGFGDDLEYADALTLGRSIVNRQEFKP
ncbi:MAG: recombination protein RecR [Bacteroidales bacterium]|nr:recombination protein RecR [Bacteroidales bacterium]